MKLKYYLRGLGIGIIVTALVMQFALGGSNEMTDAEIKKRAAELGMVEEDGMTLLEDAERAEKADAGAPISSNKVSQNRVSPNKVSQNKASQNGVSGNKVSQNAAVTDGISQNSASGNRAAGTNAKMPEVGSALDEAEDGQAERPGRQEAQSGGAADNPAQETGAETEMDSEDEFVTITIRTGESSFSAANACRDAGLVENASEFDTFLCNGGYDRRLKAGNYRIKKGASAEEIARALTGKN